MNYISSLAVSFPMNGFLGRKKKSNQNSNFNPIHKSQTVIFRFNIKIRKYSITTWLIIQVIRRIKRYFISVLKLLINANRHFTSQ